MSAIRLHELLGGIREKHSNQLIQEVNDHCVRLAVMEDRVFEWHYHPNSDEVFLVIEGELKIEFKDRAEVTLGPGDLYAVPAGVVHRTIARSRTANLCLESTRAETVFL